jgi:hypothetical protein
VDWKEVVPSLMREQLKGEQDCLVDWKVVCSLMG